VPTVICYFVKAICYFYGMSSKYKFADNDKLYFVSFAITNWIDLSHTGADMQLREKWRWRICAYRDLLFGKSHFIIFTT